MQIDVVVTGRENGLFENCYILWDDGSKEAVVIDPGEGSERIDKQIRAHGLNVAFILLTHGHADHIASVKPLREKYGAKVAIHADDRELLTDPIKNLSQFLGGPINVGEADILLKADDIVDVAGLCFTVLHTPGHTPGGICYLLQEEAMIFSGDTLFAGSIGRTDFPGSDWNAMQKSLMALAALPGDYAVYSGHGPKTTLQRERNTNPYMKR